MKKIILFTTWLFLIQACYNNNGSSDYQTDVQISLGGYVYGWSEPLADTTKCEQILHSNDLFPKLLFLDDNSFIKILPTSCGDLGACSRYYSGKYKIDNEKIALIFDPKMTVYHMRSKNLLSPFVEIENSDLKTIKLPRINCKTSLYFAECDTRGHLIAPKTDTLANYIRFMKNEKIWDKLFAKEKL